VYTVGEPELRFSFCQGLSYGSFRGGQRCGSFRRDRGLDPIEGRHVVERGENADLTKNRTIGRGNRGCHHVFIILIGL
jgi:hypothetical protein